MTKLLGFLDKNADQLPPEALISHIIWRFHDAHRRELPDLIRLSRKAEAAILSQDQKPEPLSPLLEAIANDLEHHMIEEEQILFPLMLSGRALMLDPPIKHILAEHDHHSKLIERLGKLALEWAALEGNDHVKDLLAGLRKFSDDLHQHLELETNALFPQFTRLLK